MPSVARSTTASARPGEGEALAERLLGLARVLESAGGCQLYLVGRLASEPESFCISELWRSREDIEAAFATEAVAAALADVGELLDGAGLEATELEPLGGVGSIGAEPGYALINLEEVEDMAPTFGLGAFGEARFARGDLNSATVAVSLQRLRPGRRQAFGHRHDADEEIYVVLGGSGRIAIDGEVRELRRLDAVRVAPASVRAFEAGPGGLELLATGSHHPGDAQLVPGFSPAS